MKRALFFLTSSFPFGTGETFIENEIDYLAKAFDKIIIISNDTQNPQTRTVPDNVQLLRMPYELDSKDKAKALSSIIKPDFWKELIWVSKRKKLRKGIINTMLISLYKAYKISKYLQQQSARFNEFKIYGYSYWCNDNALSLALWKRKDKNIKVFCRLHGWDLYEDRSDFKYLPYRMTTVNRLNNLFFISEQGMKYWQTNYGNSKNLKVSRLGTKCIKSSDTNKSSDAFHIVSCSSLIPLKRVHLIIEALSKVNSENKIKWTHFGGGKLYNELEELSKRLLNDKIEWELKGQASNKEVMEYYTSEQPNLFINVSETEGIPVSIMEAFSCGIPAIATAVGGTPEIVKDGLNGYLLNANTDAQSIKEIITNHINLPRDNQQEKSRNAKVTWEEYYSAEKNYKGFVEFATTL
ncbi:glycosyltransferase [Chondrinema litorale]|uniref:glycosyltransferase n=1 Tax=Chondrinema litorale TaxID=2994555 RepID=UPI0025428CE4|nr:glycosyltransferase [Chondrinema litorale]UZR92541.1 glycosyltransferase [Chondrinema litorale]